MIGVRWLVLLQGAAGIGVAAANPSHQAGAASAAVAAAAVDDADCADCAAS